MENPFSVSSQTVLRCEACFTKTGDEDIYCANCGFPLKGTVLEQRTFISRQNKMDFDLVAFKKRVKSAGNTLYYLSVFFILFAIIGFVKKQDDPNVLAFVIPNLILGILFLLLAEYSKKKTLACLISGLSLYVIVQILIIIEDPTIDLLSVILIGVILMCFVKGIKSAIEIEKIKKENNII